MRSSILSVAFVAALGLTAWSSTEAKAQVVITPSGVVATPVVTTSYYPSYSYGYNSVTPYYGSSFYGYSTPYSYGNFGSYGYNPYYTAYPYGFGRWPNYVYRNNWRGRYW